MQERHINRRQYFNEQAFTTQNYVIPHLSKFITIEKNTSVLEIGCGEGGNLQPFVDIGCSVTGIDILEHKIKLAKNFIELKKGNGGSIRLLSADIYEVSPDDIGQFDIIMMRDVIEHIPNQEKFMNFVKTFMHPKTIFFLGFPPWRMPFGGHQQTCENKILSSLPYYHLLPRSIYRRVLKAGGEPEVRIKGLFEIKDTGITIKRFNKIVHNEEYQILEEIPYLINPNYKIKFNLTPRKQWRIVHEIPYLREFFTTCYYCILQQGGEK